MISPPSNQNPFPELDQDYLPRNLPFGYGTKPSLEELTQMDEEQLSNVKNFQIWNKYANIIFNEPVDLRGVDFGKTFEISQDLVNVHPQGQSEEGNRVADKLNKRATIRFRNFASDKYKQLNVSDQKKK